GPELGLIVGIGELEEGQRPAIADAEEAMAVGAVLSEQEIGFAPGRGQRQADDVLVEVARGLEVLRHVGRMMQTAWQLAHRSSPVAPDSVRSLLFRFAV